MIGTIKNRINKISKQSIEFKTYEFVSSPIMMPVYVLLMLLFIFPMVAANVNMALIILLSVLFGISGVLLSVMLRVTIDEYNEAQDTELNETEQ